MLISTKSTDLISSDPSFIKCYVRFPTVPFKQLPDQGCILVLVFFYSIFDSFFYKDELLQSETYKSINEINRI